MIELASILHVLCGVKPHLCDQVQARGLVLGRAALAEEAGLVAGTVAVGHTRDRACVELRTARSYWAPQGQSIRPGGWPKTSRSWCHLPNEQSPSESQ